MTNLQNAARFHLPAAVHDRGLPPLLLSTILAEVAGNILYVVLLEKAYQLGGETASVGGVLLVQSVPQIFLGLWAGNLVDRLGKRGAAILATFASAGLAAGLLAGNTILAVYILAFLIMLARLVFTPARLALVSHLSSKANLVAANTMLAVASGAGLFLGPAIAAALLSLTSGFQTPLIVAGAGFLLSTMPFSFIRVPAAPQRFAEKPNAWKEMLTGWNFIRMHGPVWKVLLCLMHFTLVMGAVTPLFTPLAHALGLGPEGTGVFFATVGFGGLAGAPLAVVLAKRLGTSLTLLLTGMLAPIGILLIGLMDSQIGALAAVLLASLAGAILNVVVITVIQRLTPLNIQGRVFGVQQMLLGATWVVSLSAATGGLAIWPDVNPQLLFLPAGALGLLMFIACWFKHWRPIHNACQSCEPRFQVFGAVCQVICDSHTQFSSAACRVLCGDSLRCCY